MTGRGPKRSSARPRNGDATAIVIAAMANAREISSRLQPNSADNGLRKIPNVKTSSDPKLTIAPRLAAATTRQPG